MKFRYTSKTDLEKQAAELEKAISLGVRQVTYGGHTITYSTPDKMKEALADLYSSIDKLDPENAPRRIRVRRSSVSGKGL